MQDFIKKYKENKHSPHLSIIAVSFILAFSFFVTTKDSDISKNIKGNILEATAVQPKMLADFYITSEWEKSQIMSIKAQEKKLKKISFSLNYNPENMEVKDILSLLPSGQVQIISNTPGIMTVFFMFDTPVAIPSDTDLIRISTEKKSKDISFLNLFEANITDEEEQNRSLSTSGIDF